MLPDSHPLVQLELERRLTVRQKADAKLMEENTTEKPNKKKAKKSSNDDELGPASSKWTTLHMDLAEKRPLGSQL